VSDVPEIITDPELLAYGDHCVDVCAREFNRRPDTWPRRFEVWSDAAHLGGSVEELLDEAQLAIAPDEGRLEPRRPQRAPRASDDAERAPEVDRKTVLEPNQGVLVKPNFESLNRPKFRGHDPRAREGIRLQAHV
jgi:hypothetical protein